MRKRTTSAAWVKGTLEMFVAEGLDASALLAAAGIDAPALDAPGARVETEKISRLWELAAERAGNPTLALAQHEVVRPKSFDAVGYTMMSCPNMRGAFDRLKRYLLILSDSLTIVLSDDRGRFCATFDLDGGACPVPRQRVEYILVTVATFCRWVSGRDVGPLVVEIAYPIPANPAAYRDAFQCPVTFDAPVSALVYALDDMTRPLPTSNPQLAELHDRFAGDYLERFNQAETSYRVREAIVRRLPDGEPRREQVARDLAMSERTLQRRLEDEGASFHQLLDDTRRELAEQHLGRLKLSLGQAAYLLGFADQRSFFRACRRWFGQAPGEYRERLQRVQR
jgi:AraC-like DNA-binding protein